MENEAKKLKKDIDQLEEITQAFMELGLQLVEWSKKQVRPLIQVSGSYCVTRCLAKRSPIFLISQDIWQNLIGGAYLEEGVSLADVFDPTSKYDEVLDGYLGSFKNGVRVYTDAYQPPELRLLKDKEFVELPEHFPMDRLLLTSSYVRAEFEKRMEIKEELTDETAE